MLHLIVFLPLLGFLIAGLFGNRMGATASEYVTTGFMGVSALLSWVVFASFWLGGGEAFTVDVLRWMAVGNFTADLDQLAAGVFIHYQLGVLVDICRADGAIYQLRKTALAADFVEGAFVF